MSKSDGVISDFVMLHVWFHFHVVLSMSDFRLSVSVVVELVVKVQSSGGSSIAVGVVCKYRLRMMNWS